MIFHKPGSERGRLTRTLLGLNRPPLIERRKERLEHVMDFMDLYALYNEGQAKEVLLTELRSEANEDKEYSYMVHTFLELNEVI